jgi:hypothetical protein
VDNILAKTRSAFLDAERRVNRDLTNLNFGHELSNEVFCGGSLVLLAALAILPFSTNCFAFDFSRLIPGSLWTLIGWLNLGLIKDMIFKTIVMGGFVAQNKTRILMLEAVALMTIYALYKKALCLVSKSTATFSFFESAMNEGSERLNLQLRHLFNQSTAEQRNNPQCC